MKKIILFIAIVGFSISFFAQDVTHETGVINIEIPVRVFKGNTFIDNLTIDDFEIYEDGKLQGIEAVYLIKKVDIQREESEIEKEEARQKFSPNVSRNIILQFDIVDYLPKIDEALDHFFENVISPEDTLIVTTPVKTYSFKKETLAVLSKKKIAEQLKEIIKKDIKLGGTEYKGLIRDYLNLYRSDFEQDLKLYMMKDKIRELKNIRYLPEKKMNNFAEFLKNMPGQKYVFFFYQKELLPLPNLPFGSREYLEFQSEIMSFISFDTTKIKQIFSDSSISLHFLYITKNEMSGVSIEDMGPSVMERQDISMNIFSIFKGIAKATGGLAESSANIASLLKKAVDASENYYLLYYSPKDYKKDGKFRQIKVKVKNKNYRITHRSGYLAN